ncbi:MAG: NAD-dependent epimerase/dehydratase family protein [Geminicoccaceae bacterium]
MTEEVRMKVLVTGATGFVGSAVARKLIGDGHDVRVLVRDPSKLAAVGLGGVTDIVTGDITDPAVMDKAVDGVDCALGIAGTFREPNLSDDRYRQINVDAVRLLLDAAKRHRVRRVVHCSTVGIHGNVTGAPATEASPVIPDGIYEVTKAEGDRIARVYGREIGVDTVVLRPTPIYGPGDTRLLKLFRMAGKQRLVMLGDGSAGYHLVHVDDLAQAFLLAATGHGKAGEAYIIGGAEQPSLNELIATLADVLGRKDQKTIRIPAQPVRLLGHLCEIICRPFGINPPIYRRRVDFFINNRRYDIGKARNELGYVPKIGMRDGLEQTAAWYRARGML